MKNLAGNNPQVVDAQCRQELTEAGIPIRSPWPEFLRSKGEVPSNIVGYLGSGPDGNKECQGGWTLTRAWYYWVATWEPPATVTLTMERAIKLHEKYGDVVRVDGHCGCPSPDEWWPKNGTPNCYHIDTQEGLNAFAVAIKESYHV